MDLAGRPGAHPVAFLIALLVGALLPLAAPAAEVPTDRIIVRLKGGAASLAKSAAEQAGLARRLSDPLGEPLSPVRVMGDGAMVLRLPRRMTSAEIRSRYAGPRHPDVLEIVPDRIFQPALTPTDPQYADQWYLGASNGINAPAAWDITTGSPSLVVGILDTGKLPHDELASR